MSKHKVSAAEAAARGTKKDPEARSQKKQRVSKELKKDGHGIVIYVVVTIVIIAFLYVLHLFGIA